MAGDRQPAAVRRGDQFQDAAELAGAVPARVAVRGGDLDRIRTFRAGHVRQRRARVGGWLGQDHRQPVSHPRCGGDRRGRAVAVGQPDHVAPDLDGAGPAGPVHRVGAEMLARSEFEGRPADPGTGQLDLQPTGLAVSGQIREQPDLAGVLVHQPAAVAGQLAGVVLLVVGVPAQLGARGVDRVDVAVALEVGQEGIPLSDRHRAGLGAGNLGQDLGELAAAVRIQPEPAGGTASVSLPVRGILVLAGGQQHRPRTRPGDVDDRTVRQPLWRGIGIRRRVDGPGPPSAGHRLAGCRGNHHPAGRVEPEAAYPLAAEVGQLARFAAGDRHHERLRPAGPAARSRPPGGRPATAVAG